MLCPCLGHLPGHHHVPCHVVFTGALHTHVYRHSFFIDKKTETQGGQQLINTISFKGHRSSVLYHVHLLVPGLRHVQGRKRVLQAASIAGSDGLKAGIVEM